MEDKTEGLSSSSLYWYNHIKALEKNREPAVVYTKRHHLNIQTLYDWKHKFYKTGILTKSKKNQINFQKVTIQKQEPEADSSPVKMHFPNGVIVEMHEGCSERRITALLESWK